MWFFPPCCPVQVLSCALCLHHVLLSEQIKMMIPERAQIIGVLGTRIWARPGVVVLGLLYTLNTQGDAISNAAGSSLTDRPRILSQQLSCSEATAWHCQTCAGCPGTIFYVSTRRHLGASTSDTVAFLERERREKCVVVYKRLCPCTGHTNSDNFEPICHDN